VAQKVKENLFWTEHYLFMVHLSLLLGAAHKKGYFIRIYFSRAPAGTFVSLLSIPLLPLE
jgi:hypothetical protein